MRAVSDGGQLGPPARAVQSWRSVARDAALVVVGSAVVAMSLNALRRDRLPWIQRAEYQILVPCPETAGQAGEVPADRALLEAPHMLVLDARSTRDYRAWHVERALHVAFDYLEPTPSDMVRRLASSGAKEVVVYGDGLDPDSGEQLARELSGKGLRNVRFVRGGAPALIALEHQGATR